MCCLLEFRDTSFIGLECASKMFKLVLYSRFVVYVHICRNINMLVLQKDCLNHTLITECSVDTKHMSKCTYTWAIILSMCNTYDVHVHPRDFDYCNYLFIPANIEFAQALILTSSCHFLLDRFVSNAILG